MRNQRLGLNNEIRKKIDDYSYGLNDKIGKGFSSVVFRGLNEKTREQVAIKVIDIKSIKDKPAQIMLKGEIQALTKLNHRNIMKCNDIYNTVNNCYIITEFCNEGDLENLLKKRQKISEQEAIPLMRDIFLGFKTIAEAGYLHRDLKPANILIHDKVAKIADFGFAKKASLNSKQTINVGSPLYMAPEALKNNIYTIKNDIWSIGVVFYQIVHGKAPWSCSTEKQLLNRITRNTFTLMSSLSQQLKDFIRRCLNPIQQTRISLKEMKSHPFIRQILQEDAIPQLIRKQTSQQQISHQIKQIQNPINFESYQSKEPTSLHHRKNQGIQIPPQEKQMYTQINWMRFLYRLNQFFPESSQNLRYTLGLRFIIIKQLFIQLQSLKNSIEGQNPFGIQNWSQFLTNLERIGKYRQVLQEYTKKYQRLNGVYSQWSAFVTKDKKLNKIVNNNFNRSQFLSMLAINFTIQQCRNIWNELRSNVKQSQEQLPQKIMKEALRLDFLMSYYQLNSLLVDNFTDPHYFSRLSQLDIIIEAKPAQLQYQHLKDLQKKLNILEIIKN